MHAQQWLKKIAKFNKIECFKKQKILNFRIQLLYKIWKQHYLLF